MITTTMTQNRKVNMISDLILQGAKLLKENTLSNLVPISSNDRIERIIKFIDRSCLNVNNYNIYRVEKRIRSITNIPLFVINKDMSSTHTGIYHSLYEYTDEHNQIVSTYMYNISKVTNDLELDTNYLKYFIDIIEDINKVFFTELKLNYQEVMMISLLSLYEAKECENFLDIFHDDFYKNNRKDLNNLKEYLDGDYQNNPDRELYKLFIDLKLLEYLNEL